MPSATTHKRQTATTANRGGLDFVPTTTTPLTHVDDHGCLLAFDARRKAPR